MSKTRKYMNVNNKSKKNKTGGTITKTNKPKSIMKPHTTNNEKKKQIIRLHLQKNKTKTYSLDSEEKRNKRYSLPDLPRCDKINIYPCKYKNTVFDNSDEYEEYMELKKNRNANTGYKSRTSHYSEMHKQLKNTGSVGKKIPTENRLHDPYSGKIYDKTTLKFGDKLLVNY